jgi:beta-glucanase (GH16 family)
MYRNYKQVRHLQFILFFVCLFLFSEKSSEQGTTVAPLRDATTITPTYQLVWSDEFDGSTINTNYWNFETGGSGWGNHEQEYYQAANAGIEGGNLVITARKESVDSNGCTSARMTTQGKKEFFYGKVEARIKIPVGQGFWPAFWMLGSDINTVNWPACGEIDIMEHINSDSIIYGTAHWDNNGHVQDGGKTTSSPSQYHVYGVEWDANYIKWSIDSVEYHKVSITGNSTDEFHQPFFILLNFAVGGDWPGQAIDNSLLPAKMYVDWVRVYQKK